MTHFDFKCLLPALLHVEDRMSMAHGLESRVPLLDHPLIEFAATLPADIKFEGGQTKHLLKTACAGVLPAPLIERRDKMGFPVPLKEWFEGELRDMIIDVFPGPPAPETVHTSMARLSSRTSTRFPGSRARLGASSASRSGTRHFTTERTTIARWTTWTRTTTEWDNSIESLHHRRPRSGGLARRGTSARTGATMFWSSTTLPPVGGSIYRDIHG